jgi:hypothetical protein
MGGDGHKKHKKRKNNTASFVGGVLICPVIARGAKRAVTIQLAGLLRRALHGRLAKTNEDTDSFVPSAPLVAFGW